MFPLRLCGSKLSVTVTRERCYGPSRLRVNDDDDDDSITNQLLQAIHTNMSSFSWSMSSRAGKWHADNTITLRPYASSPNEYASTRLSPMCITATTITTITHLPLSRHYYQQAITTTTTYQLCINKPFLLWLPQVWLKTTTGDNWSMFLQAGWHACFATNSISMGKHINNDTRTCTGAVSQEFQNNCKA